MKLLQELLSIRSLAEEAIEVKAASDIWKESSDSSKTYIPRETVMVKKVQDSDPVEYEVYSDDGNKRKLIAKMDVEELESSYVSVRPNQKEDAEGFTVYRSSEELEAFRYDSDTVRVDLDGSKATLKKGDYLTRITEDDEFIYDVQSAKEFEDSYMEKK